MTVKRFLAMMLAIGMVFSTQAPIFATFVEDENLQLNSTTKEEIETPVLDPTFSADLVREGDAAGLYVTLENVPQDLVWIDIKYSFGGLDYMFDAKWFEGEPGLVDENGKVTLFCYRLDEYPMVAFLAETVGNLYIKATYMTAEYDNIALEPIRFYHDKEYETPGDSFSLEFKMGNYSYDLIGNCTTFHPNVARIQLSYSWDGITYAYNSAAYPRKWDLQNLGDTDPEEREDLERQEIVKYYEEPLASFLDGSQDTFYMRQDITLENGETYSSAPAMVSRIGGQLMADNFTITPRYGFNFAGMGEMAIPNGDPDDEDCEEMYVGTTFGKLEVTVREDATPEEIAALLPKEVPVRVFFWDAVTDEKYAYGDLSVPINWKNLPELTLTAGKTWTLRDMAQDVVIPAGTQVETLLGNYTLKEPLGFVSMYHDDRIELAITTVAQDALPNVAIRAYNHDVKNDGDEMLDLPTMDEPMSIAFWNKPSSATAVTATVLVGDNRIELGNLLEKRSIDHNQAHALYGYVDILRADEYPFREYLAQELAGFSVEIAVEGGVYGGKQVTLEWPMAYEGPERVFDPRGIEGQENNVGSGVGNGNDGGQRPNLPDVETDNETDEVKPPVEKPIIPGGGIPPVEILPPILPPVAPPPDGNVLLPLEPPVPEENGGNQVEIPPVIPAISQRPTKPKTPSEAIVDQSPTMGQGGAAVGIVKPPKEPEKKPTQGQGSAQVNLPETQQVPSDPQGTPIPLVAAGILLTGGAAVGIVVYSKGSIAATSGLGKLIAAIKRLLTGK